MPAERRRQTPRGVDHDFVVRGWRPDGTLRTAATLRDPESGRSLEVLSDQPGIQVYMGNFLDGTLAGKGGAVYVKHGGICLETQKYPDSIHHPEWPTSGSIQARPTGIRWSTGSAPARRTGFSLSVGQASRLAQLARAGFGLPIPRRRTFTAPIPGLRSLGVTGAAPSMAPLVTHAGSRDTGSPKPPSGIQLRRLGAARALERAMEASAAMDGESEADMQRAEAWRAEANVKREAPGSHEPDWASRARQTGLFDHASNEAHHAS